MHNQSAYDNYDRPYQLISSPERIQGLLRPLIGKHNLATVTIAGCTEPFSSIILEADHETGELLIDGLHPENGNQLLKDADRSELDTQLDGVHIQFTINLKHSGEKDGAPYHVALFPAEIKYWQRRQAFRVDVSPGYDISVDLQTEKGERCTGQLFDISIGGMCIRFPRKDILPESFSRSSVTCSLQLPDSRIECPLKILHSWRNTSSNSLHAGAQFVSLNNAQHRAIQRFVTQVQRTQRQNVGR